MNAQDHPVVKRTFYVLMHAMVVRRRQLSDLGRQFHRTCYLLLLVVLYNGSQVVGIVLVSDVILTV